MIAKQPLMLTNTGREELATRVHRLDAMARNILFMIDKGTNTADTIVQRSVFPREAVLDRIARLLRDGFLAGGNAGRPLAAAADGAGSSVTLQLLPDVSLSQARFALSDFCLDHFGTRAQGLVQAIDRCGDLGSLQRVLDGIHSEVRQHFGDRLPELLLCVREINQTAS